MEEDVANNKNISIDMENMKISKLAWKISLPMIISMLSIALYGIIDTIFVSKIEQNALTAIILVYPMYNIITEIALGLGIGVNSLLSRTLGEKNSEKCQKIIINGLKLTIISWMVIAVFCAIFSEKLMCFFTDNYKIVSLGTIYFKITGILSIGSFFQITYEKILEAHGKTKDSMIIQISGAVINLVLDPILIFGIYNFNGLGISGAAIATVIGQCFGMLYGFYLIVFRYKIVMLRDIITIKLEKSIVKQIYQVGLPTTMLEIVTSMAILVLNKVLIELSDYAVDVWGIYQKIQKFFLITIYGLNYGMIPIVGYNVGAKKQGRVKETIRYFIKLAIIITFIGTIIFVIFPNKLIGWFTDSQEVIDLGTDALRIMGIGLVFGGVNLVISATFQSFGEGNYSLIVTLFRKFLISLPLILLLKNIFGIYIVWWSMVFSEVITIIISIILLKKALKKLNLTSN